MNEIYRFCFKTQCRDNTSLFCRTEPTDSKRSLVQHNIHILVHLCVHLCVHLKWVNIQVWMTISRPQRSEGLSGRTCLLLSTYTLSISVPIYTWGHCVNIICLSVDPLIDLLTVSAPQKIIKPRIHHAISIVINTLYQYREGEPNVLITEIAKEKLLCENVQYCRNNFDNIASFCTTIFQLLFQLFKRHNYWISPPSHFGKDRQLFSPALWNFSFVFVSRLKCNVIAVISISGTLAQCRLNVRPHSDVWCASFNVHPNNLQRRHIVVLLFGQLCRRWPSIKLTSIQLPVLTCMSACMHEAMTRYCYNVGKTS